MKDFEIHCDESRLEKNNTLYGKFTLGPFLLGQGTTFGNALRRSLLSELPGLGITAFEILGIMQEFSTVPGLRESVLDLSLNLKKIVLTGILPSSIPSIGFLKVRGPALIKASDLKLPPGIYCTSPGQHIATLASTGILHIKFLISVGKGHSTQPYSLYRSLSKVKLLPTLSANLVNSDMQNDLSSLRTESIKSSHFFEQRNEENSHRRSLFDETKELEKMSKIGVDNPPLKTHLSLQRYSKTVPSSKSGLQHGHSNEGNREEISPSMIERRDSESFPETDLNLSPPYLDNARGRDLNSLTPRESSKASLADQGQGYINVQKQIFQRINPHQVLPIDAVFTPVSQVNFLIQVNDRFETLRENIVLEIWTNGSIHPKRALEEATLSLVQNFDTLLKNIQQSSSFYKGLHYWKYFQPVEVGTQQAKDKDISPVRSKGPAELPHMIDYANKFSTFQGSGKNTSPSLKSSFEKDIISGTDLYFPLQRAIYNLDIGNLDLSLQTFILLKQAKINTLSQLLTNLSSKEKSVLLGEDFLSENTVKELNKVISQFGINY